MKRPLILHLLDKFYPPDPRVDGEMKALNEAGFQTKLAVFQKEPFLREDVINLPMAKNMFRFSALAYTIPVYQWYIKYYLRKVIRREQPDFLHVHDITMAEAVRQLSEEFKIPYILDLHENRPEIMQYYPFMKRPLSRLLINLDHWRIAEKRLMNAAQHCIVVTEEARAWYVEHFKITAEKITVTPNAVDETFIRIAENRDRQNLPGELRMIYIGETSARRGIESVIKAVAILRDKRINVHCTILGRGRDDNHWKTMLNRLSLNEHIIFGGWVGYEEIHAALQSCNIGLCPILKNIHHDTTYANKIFQYMAYGLVNVVSDCDAQANLVQQYHCGLIHKGGDENDLAKKLLWLVNHPDTINAMGENGRTALKNGFTPTKVHAALVAYYREAATA